MPILKTQITINAAPQTVWSSLDNLPAYPGWNRLVPDLTGIDPAAMTAIRAALTKADIPAYDAFSPELMDLIAWHCVTLHRHHEGALA